MPCGGACPASQCVLGACPGDQPDASPEPEPEPEGLDVGPEDAALEPEAPPDAGQDAAEDVPEEPDVVDEPPGPQGCADDEACEPGTICDARQDPPSCVPGCRQDVECPEDLVCSQALGQCVLGCGVDDDCPEGERCDPLSQGCIGVDCLRDSQCATAQYCDVDLGLCTFGCRSGECAPGQYCDLEVRGCLEGDCAVDLECPRDQFCDGLSQLCRPGCRENGDCEEVEVCAVVQRRGEVEHVCLPPACAQDRDCAIDSYCGPQDGFDRQICLVGCRIPNNCPRGSTCDPEARVCAPEGCEGDSDCQEGEICVEGGEVNVCRVGCRQDSQCAEGQLCFVQEGVCSCDVARDCPVGQSCHENVCVRACRGDGDCAQGESCDQEIRACVVGCRDDFQEPNDALFEAAVVEPQVYEGLRMCYLEPPAEAAQDCYRLDIIDDIGATLRVTLGFDHDRGDLNIFLIEPGFVEVSRSEGREDGEVVEALIGEVGTWRFCVLAAGAPFQSSYRMAVEVVE